MNDTSETTTPKKSLGGAVSETLDRLEILIGKMGISSSVKPVEILEGMDAVYGQIQQLEGKISRKTAEGQFESIQKQLRSQAILFLKTIGGPDTLRALRAEHKPPVDHWWWYLDEWLAQNRKAKLRAASFAGLGVLIGLVLVVLAYEVFFKPDPVSEARDLHEQNAQNWVQQGKYDQALSEVDQSLQYAPQDTSLLALKGVILTQLGKSGEAQQVFAQAEKSAAKREDFLSWRATAYLLAGQADPALADVQAILQMDPQSVQAYMISGQAYEVKKNYSKSLDEYGKAYDLADKQGSYAQAAVARVRMANVLQQLNSPTGPELTTPTP